MKTRILLATMAMVFMSSVSITTRTVTGRVTFSEDGSALPGVNVFLKNTREGVVTDADGRYSIRVPQEGGTLVFSFIGFTSLEIKTGARSIVNVVMQSDVRQLSEVIVGGKGIKRDRNKLGTAYSPGAIQSHQDMGEYETQPVWDTEEYDAIHENIFHGALQNPLSTFSIDVDAASYSNMRRFIRAGQRPPKDAIRIEELINYFDYAYAQPQGEDPFSIYTEISAAPWNEKHQLVHIGLQGRKIPTDNLPASNLVFLVDVSGSMDSPNKLPLLKASFRLLVDQLRDRDRVAIVVYAGAAGVVLPSTSGADKKTILDALENLQAGGSTAGGAGIQLAYAIAKQNFHPNGNNRIILATDGDFNVGESSNAGMERLIEEKRGDGIFLTVLGFGMGNYKDSKMEILADKGNGNYAYIDNILEAQKVLVNEFGGTMFTIAKDVKLQVEFNPALVKAYRLIGYENRALRNEDFNNDKKDAGELGSGHTVTALYEIIPVGVESSFYKMDELKYQKQIVTVPAQKSNELLTIKFRYKTPQGTTSKLIVHPLRNDVAATRGISENFKWSAAIAAFGMLLRDSEYIHGFTIDQVLALAETSRGADKEGYRAEFISLVKSVGLVASR
ncbi:MAG: von Willebrand factor type A domain-containing protein [Cytophagales bacterium]|nr:von Willebrand factor type A domain-containing protein [Cytophagales bacterium]